MHQSLLIRAGRVDDFPTVYAINARSTPGVSLLVPGDLERALALAALTWVAVVDDAVCAYLLAYRSTAGYDGEEFAWFRSRDRDFLYVDQLAVAPHCRRRGCGAALYAALEAHARGERVPALTCEVNVLPPNPGSMAFHFRHGFVEVDRMRTGDGRWVALLRKSLADPSDHP